MSEYEELRREFQKQLNSSLKTVHEDIRRAQFPFEVQINDSVVMVNREMLLDYFNEKIK